MPHKISEIVPLPTCVLFRTRTVSSPSLVVEVAVLPPHVSKLPNRNSLSWKNERRRRVAWTVFTASKTEKSERKKRTGSRSSSRRIGGEYRRCGKDGVRCDWRIKHNIYEFARLVEETQVVIPYRHSNVALNWPGPCNRNPCLYP